ncbi:hypothetical protein [Spiroplasma poulsonii]|nr:hypothetical protein [Spiroplasma poulsonii]
MNPEKDVQISIKTPEFDTLTGKSKFVYNRLLAIPFFIKILL